MVRPLWTDPTRQVEESIAKTRYIRSRNLWQVLWKRADNSIEMQKHKNKEESALRNAGFVPFSGLTPVDIAENRALPVVDQLLREKISPEQAKALMRKIRSQAP